MKQIQIGENNKSGIYLFTNSYITDIVIILLIFVLSTILIQEERQKNLFTLVRSTKHGRSKTMVAKLISLIISIIGISILFYLINAIYYGLTSGFGNWFVSIQSIKMFIGSTLTINILEYMILFIATKIAVYLIVSLIAVWLSIHVRYSGITYLAFGATFLVSVIIYRMIPNVSNMNFFKYINLVSMLNTNGIFGEYRNLNILGYPIKLTTAIAIFIFITLSITTFLNIVSFARKKDLSMKKYGFYKIWKHIPFPKYQIRQSLLYFEIYKLFITNKVLPILVICLVLIAGNYINTNKYISMSEYYYKDYMAFLEGEITKEKEEFIQSKQQEFDGVQEEIENIERSFKNGEISKIEANELKSRFSDKLAEFEIFKVIKERYDYIKQNPGAEFLYDSGYYYLLGMKKKNDLESAMMLVILCIICFSNLFSMEYRVGSIKIISTTPKGRNETAKAKMIACFIAVSIIFVLSNISNILLTLKYYGLHNLTASVISLPVFVDLPNWISLFFYIVIMYVVQMMGAVSIMGIIIWVSVKMKNHIYTILIATAILFIPILLVVMGLDFAKVISIIPIFNITHVANGKEGIPAVCILMPVIIGIYCMIYVYQTFGKKSSSH